MGEQRISPISLQGDWPCLHRLALSTPAEMELENLVLQRWATEAACVPTLTCSEPWFAPEKRCSEGTMALPVENPCRKGLEFSGEGMG